MADFKVGDVVVALISTVSEGGDQLVKDRLYRISGVFSCPLVGGAVNVHGLNPAPYTGYAAKLFRHLPKSSDEFTAQMRSLRPLKDKVNG